MLWTGPGLINVLSEYCQPKEFCHGNFFIEEDTSMGISFNFRLPTIIKKHQDDDLQLSSDKGVEKNYGGA